MIATKIVIIAIAVVVSLTFIGIGGTYDANAYDSDLTASGSSWEQFLEYVETKEGGTKVNESGEKDSNGKYYIVENDGAGNPTIGHGLCLHAKAEGDNGYYHVEEFKEHDIDSKKLATDWYNGVKGKVEVEICDAIWDDHLKGIYDNIVSKYSDLKLEEYQYYALTDVKYRRGNTDGFETKYKDLWKGSNDKYYKKDTSKEKYSTDTLYSFFWNGGHDLSGVNTRKKEQWLLFKYGYYAPLKEYWEESKGGEYSLKGDGCVIAEFKSGVTHKTFSIINQNAKIDGETIFPSECNRACGVTILTGYSNKSVGDLIKLGQEKGNGFPYNNANMYEGTGLSVINKNELVGDYSKVKSTITKEISKGNYIMLRFNGKTIGASGKQWASPNGHWIAILGTKKEKGKTNIFVADPGWGRTGWWDIDEFKNVSTRAELKIIEPKKGK